MTRQFAKLWVVGFAATLIAGSPQAQTADETLMKSARSIARIGLIEPICSPFYLLDRKRLAEVKGWMLQDGVERFGAVLIQRTVDRVRSEFLGVIKREGAAGWCPAQRAFYKVPGQPEFIGSPLE
ncbi:hypothetical protein ASF28_02910 [Methylobacterium sp. Leaf99]|uniref:hypothetical protein n=1 Tax=Methylobacterium sp. Leaf99 TaxID=1736251 RepID=UPI0006F8B1D3|nr:hypothetical protein [Methylobacterium sp. Leaf99]KQP10123.1 hypothetical protein ASF28_02910 [Methylobacterium sp. Leaf99]